MAILRFTDDTYDEVLEQYRDRAQEDVRAEDLQELLPWDEDLGERFRLLNPRLLADVMSTADTTFFFAQLRGDTLGWFDLTYDARSREEVLVRASNTGVTAGLPDVWASFDRRDQARNPEASAGENPSPVDILSYDIDVTIDADEYLNASTLMRLAPRRSGERVLSFNLARTLRLSEVTLGGDSIPFFQHPVSSGESPDLTSDTLVIMLPNPTEQGEELTLLFRYAGRVLDRRGEGIFYIRESSFWYPSPGLKDPAVYDMVFHYPADRILAASGRKFDEREDGGVRHSWWNSGRELFLAGFNYGDFSIQSDETGSVPIYLYLSNDVENVYAEIEARRAFEAPDAARTNPEDPNPEVTVENEVFSTNELGDNILEETRSRMAFLSDSFVHTRLTSSRSSSFQSRFQWDGPRWSTSRRWGSSIPINANDSGSRRFALVRRTSCTRMTSAHQWFGNKVGWASYRDEWIFEGFTNYAGAIVSGGEVW